MTRPHTLLLCTLGLLLVPTCGAIACSCARPATAPEAFASAKVVYLAKLLRTTKTQASANPAARYSSESARFRILHTWKGERATGTEIETKSDVGPGSCGLSATNDPPWAVAADGNPVPISEIWILYLYEDEPAEISICSRSHPIDLNGEPDLPILYRLERSATSKPGHRT